VTLREFIQQVTAIVQVAGEPDVPGRVAEVLPALLANPSVLDVQQRTPGTEGYRQHVLHVDRAGAFSIVALVWLPGQVTPVHDHLAWCVFGVYEGMERETQYRLIEEGAGRLRVAPTRVLEYARGRVGYAPSLESDIHRVENSGDDLAISIHIYGTDFRKVENSIRRRYRVDD
jgi:predicted metal-dependent enzyme (double-stranded beta helix superfamily)